MDQLSICQSCRSCCTGTDIRLIDEDMQRWKKENRLDILLAINPLLGGSRQLIKKKNSDDCIFLTDDYICTIYDTRPYICRMFPRNIKHAKEFGCKLVEFRLVKKVIEENKKQDCHSSR